MKRFWVIIVQNNQVLDILVREALLSAAATANVSIEVSMRSDWQEVDISHVDKSNTVIIIVSNDGKISNNSSDTISLNGANVYHVSFFDVLKDAVGLFRQFVDAASVSENASQTTLDVSEGNEHHSTVIKNIVAVTSCPTGVAHTFMAAEALLDSAKALGINMRVETQGSVGTGTPLTASDIKNADLVIIAADKEVDQSRFIGKRLYISSTKAVIYNGVDYLKEAIINTTSQPAQTNSNAKSKNQSSGSDVYKHLMSGVSYMLPFVVAGGLLIALAYALGGVDVFEQQGTFASHLYSIGVDAAFFFMLPILAGFIAFSIADRPGLAPGMIGGLLAQQISSGFIGGIIAGFLAGYFVLLLLKFIKLPRNLNGLMPVLIVPFLSTLIIGFMMIYVVSSPVSYINLTLESWLKSLQGPNAALLGLVLGAMMASDLGGPINKAAYAFSVFLLANGASGPMAATMIAGMTPPIALACAAKIFPSRFTQEERDSKVATFILGLSFISEGAIPFAARDPFRVIPALFIGSALAGAIALGFGSMLTVPHGGIFLILIPNVVSNYLAYGAALVAGILVSTLCLGLFKKTITDSASS